MFSSQIVSVIFQKAASGVGIDPSSETNNVRRHWTIVCYNFVVVRPDMSIFDFQIEAGSKVELPFWLAHELQLRQAVSINVPPCFNQK